MKKIIEFNIPEDNEEYKIYNQAMDMHLALWNFSQEILRQATKYGHFNGKELTEAEQDLFEDIKTKFYEILNEYNVDLG